MYIDGEEWEALKKRHRHEAVTRAELSRLTTPVIVSHASAGALWGFPILDEWPTQVHVYDLGRTRAQRTATLTRHVTIDTPSRTMRAGLPCTTSVRTAVDMALDGFLQALLVFDNGLNRRLFTREEIASAVERRGRVRGIQHARRALPLADALAGSAGESISRGTIHDLGFPAPVLQKEFPSPWGGSYFVDFWWQELGLVGEFDGDQKYLDEAMRSGRTIEKVMLNEKQRESDIRALREVQNVVRWRYAAARNPTVLSRILRAAGLPLLAYTETSVATPRGG